MGVDKHSPEKGEGEKKSTPTASSMTLRKATDNISRLPNLCQQSDSLEVITKYSVGAKNKYDAILSLGSSREP